MRSTGPSSTTRQLIWDRGNQICESCAVVPGTQIHHRKPRQLGGTRDEAINEPQNLLLLCNRCHAWIESNRTLAYEAGWLVHRNDDPAEVPVVIGRRLVRLDRDAGYLPVQMP